MKFITYERYIYTKDTISNPRTVSKGVPQGGVFSPLLYIIYVMDIEQDIPSDHKLLQFADDIAIYNTTNDIENNITDFEDSISILGRNLASLGLGLNSKKTLFLCFNRKRNFITDNLKINVNNTNIYASPSAKFLGIHFDTKLNFRTHLRMVQAKSNKALNILKFIRGTW